MKAGLMEIADFFIMNKCEPRFRTGAVCIKNCSIMRHHDEHSWVANILSSVATNDTGIDEIANEIEKHKNYLIKENCLIKEFNRLR